MKFRAKPWQPCATCGNMLAEVVDQYNVIHLLPAPIEIAEEIADRLNEVSDILSFARRNQIDELFRDTLHEVRDKVVEELAPHVTHRSSPALYTGHVR